MQDSRNPSPLSPPHQDLNPQLVQNKGHGGEFAGLLSKMVPVCARRRTRWRTKDGVIVVSTPTWNKDVNNV